MNTQSNEYVTRISSGTILALLAFSGLLLLVPAVTPVHASNASLPTLTFTPNVLTQGTGSDISIKVTNPSTNAYAITGLVITVPSGFLTSFGCSAGTVLGSPVALASSCSWSSSTGLTPGSSDTVKITAANAVASTTGATSGSFTSTVQDASSSAFYSGAASTEYAVIAGTTVAIAVTVGGSNTQTSYTAGTAAYTVKATVASGSTAESGLPVVWSDDGVATGTSSFSPTTGTTDSKGTTSTTFQPSNTAGDTGIPEATLGNSAIDGADSSTITTQAAAPSSVTVSISGDSDESTVYVTAHATPGYVTSGQYAELVALTGITGTLTDAFGNAVTSGISFTGSQGCTITGFGGSFDNAGTAASSNSPTAGGTSCSASGAISNSLNYFQSGNYGTTSYVQVQITGTYASASFTASGLSATIKTSTFDTAIVNGNIAASAKCTLSGGSCTSGSIVASLTASPTTANTIKVTYTLSVVQSGVPVTFLAINGTTPALGSFVGGMGTAIHHGSVADPANVTAYSVVSSGTATATATYTIDTTVGDSAVGFEASVAAPTTESTSASLGPTTETSTFNTIAGAATALSVGACFTSTCPDTSTFITKSVAGQKLYLDVVLNDNWGNVATNPGQQIQISLSVSPSTAGTLSASSVYISQSCPDTYGTGCTSFGSILFQLGASASGTITVSASGLYTGSGTITIVSANPTITVNTPSGTVGHTIYSKLAGVSFSGTAKVSAGVYPAPTIAAINYTVDGGKPTTAGTSSPWSFVATLTNGLHTIGVYAVDSKSAVSSTNSTTVLVDTAAPTITATTTSGSTITAGSSVVFSVVDSEGDLKASSLSASFNGTGTLTATITSGTNNPGSSVTYSVSVSGLPTSTGHWGVTLTAADWAGNSATSSTVVVKVLAQTGVSSFSSTAGATASTSGGFKGASITFTNNEGQAATVNVFFVWYNSANQVVSVGAQLNVAFSTGQSQTFFGSYQTSGTYTVKVFIQDATGNALSTSYSVSVTI